MISFIHALFALLFRGAFLLLMLLIFLLICFNSLSFRIFLTVFLPCLFLKNLACVLVGSGYLHALNLVSLVRAGWKWLPTCLETCACWLVCPCALLVESGYLHALKLVPCWFVCPCGSCLLEVITCIP